MTTTLSTDELTRMQAEMTAFLREGKPYDVAPGPDDVHLIKPSLGADEPTDEMRAAALRALHLWLPLLSPLGVVDVVYRAMRQAAGQPR